MTDLDRANEQVRWPGIALALGSVVTLVAGATALGFGALGTRGSGGQTFLFIALLIIFMAALAVTASVFSWMRMTSAAEAFGLPTGSVRALLALGIMILFVVFGLPLISPVPSDTPDRVSSTAIQTVPVPNDMIQSAIAEHKNQGLVVIVSDYGRARGTLSATDPGAPGRIEIYAKVKARAPEELDLSKQMLTAIVTLLTTVIGFYFGSRSTTDLARHQP